MDLTIVIVSFKSGEVLDRCIKSIDNKKTEKFIAGGEESFGYLVDDFVRDKDAIISCAYICEIANWAKDRDKSLNDILEEIYETYGLFIEKLYTIG